LNNEEFYKDFYE
jgi:hypothetical protein